MKFKYSLFVVLVASALMILYSYLTGMARDVFVAGATMWIAGSIVTVVLNDLVFKWTTEREKLVTWQYCVGTFIALLSVLAFLWASESVVFMENLFRLALAVFSAFVGSLWFHLPYKTSIMGKQEKEQRRWDKAEKRIAKAKTVEAKKKIIDETLRYYLTGSTPDRKLDFDKPLVPFDGKCLTAKEIGFLVTDDPSNEFNIMSDAAKIYTAQIAEEV